MNDMYRARDKAYRRRRRRRKKIINNILEIVTLIIILAVITAFVAGVFVLTKKIFFNKDDKPTGQTVILENLDNPGDMIAGNDKETQSGSQSESDSQKEESSSTQKPTEGVTQAPTQAPGIDTQAPEVDGTFVYFYGLPPLEPQNKVQSYTKEPYEGTVKEGFKQLNQIYRTPKVETYENDGFFENTLFVGDSITTGITIYNNTYDYDLPAKVLADKGYTIGKIMLRKNEIIATKPKRMFILVGSNDLNSANPNIESIATRYVQAVEELQAALPDTKIYIMLTLPINSKYEKKASIRNAKITEFDNRLVQLCNERGIYYIDMATSLKDENGVLVSAISDDGLHLKGQYYAYWYNLIRDVITVNEKLEEESNKQEGEE